MSEDVDYLSDEFILNPSSDIRPGLLFSKQQKRHHEISKKVSEANKRSKTKPLRVLEAEKRDEALGASLTPSNKGFSMLLRMGYKPGTEIGKKGIGGSEALKEPLRPVVKNNRFGLGQEAEQKEKMEKRVSRLKEHHLNQVRNAEQLAVSFQARVRDQRKDRQVQGDLWKSQKVCLQLDTEASASPQESWFWPEAAQPTEEEEEDQGKSEEEEEEEDLQRISIERSERLKVLTQYLRGTYFYCLWCGVKYEDEQDLQCNCPGSTSEDHE